MIQWKLSLQMCHAIWTSHWIPIFLNMWPCWSSPLHLQCFLLKCSVCFSTWRFFFILIDVSRYFLLFHTFTVNISNGWSCRKDFSTQFSLMLSTITGNFNFFTVLWFFGFVGDRLCQLCQFIWPFNFGFKFLNICLEPIKFLYSLTVQLKPVFLCQYSVSLLH